MTSNILTKTLTDIKKNISFAIPVILFIVVTLLYLFSGISTAFAGCAFFFQIFFGLWLFIVSIVKKLTMWPIIVFGLVFFIIGLFLLVPDDSLLEKAQKEYDNQNYYSAQQYLNETSENSHQKQQYIDLKKMNDSMIVKYTSSILSKAKKEINEGDFASAKETLDKILQYDSNNPEALSLLNKINESEQKKIESDFAKKESDKISSLFSSVNKHLISNEPDKAQEVLDKFKEENPGIGQNIGTIIDLQKRTTFALNKKTITTSYAHAVDLFKNKNYSECVETLDNILNLDKNNIKAIKLKSNALKLQKREDENFWFKFKIVLAIVGIVILIVAGYAQHTKCPKCRKPFARHLENVELISTEPFYKTITREDVTRDRHGRVKSTTERDEQIRMIRKVYDEHYICKKCSHTWIVQDEQEVEG